MVTAKKKITVTYADYSGRDQKVEANLASVGTHTDAWEKTAGEGCCEAVQEGGRTTWFLCRKSPVKALGVDTHGSVRALCGRHVGHAKRARRKYHDTVIALLTPDGSKQTHGWSHDGLVEADR